MNESAGTSFRNQTLGEITDGLYNLGSALGISNRQVTGATGFVDEFGNFHPRTCFVAGTLVTKLKVEYYELARNGDLTPDVKYEEKIAIETIKAGDFVLSFNDVTKVESYKKVTDTFVRVTDLIYTIRFMNGEKLETTWNHPFYILKKSHFKERASPQFGASLVSARFIDSENSTLEDSSTQSFAGEWIFAKDLKAGDVSMTAGGKRLLIASITPSSQSETVYNFSVADNHTYFVGVDGVLVHNDNGYSNQRNSNAQPRLSLSEIEERYDGFLNFTGIEERFQNWSDDRGFVKDYTVDEGSFGIDKTMTVEQEKYLMDTLNSLATSVSFERDKNGDLKMIQRNNTNEEFPITKDFLKEMFLDKDFKINFLDKNKKVSTKKGSVHVKDVNASKIIDPAILNDFPLNESKKQSFILLDSDHDKMLTVWGKQNGKTKKIKLPNDIVFLHELIHAYRYKSNLSADNRMVTVRSYDNRGKEKFKNLILEIEEAFTVGEGLALVSPSHIEEIMKQKYSENLFRKERKLPVRISYEITK